MSRLFPWSLPNQISVDLGSSETELAPGSWLPIVYPRKVRKQVRIQVKSRYATDSNKGVFINRRSLNAFDYLIVALLNIGYYYGADGGPSGPDGTGVLHATQQSNRVEIHRKIIHTQQLGDTAMRTYFVRHTRELDLDDATRETLWRRQIIAVHYPHDKHGNLGRRDNSSLNPDDYVGAGRKSMRVIGEIAKDGGYMCAEYYRHAECLVGYVEPNSCIEILRGRWGCLNDQEGREATLKCLPLRKTRIIERAAMAVILVGRPRQGTISRWPGAGKLIESLVQRKPLTPSLELLSPDQQEVLCSEFLRSGEAVKAGLPKLAHLLALGRTMRDIDIAGVTTEGRRLFAQVTYRTFEESASKLRALQEYSGSGRNALILFCKCSSPQQRDGVWIASLQQVYEDFVSTTTGASWLKAAIREV